MNEPLTDPREIRRLLQDCSYGIKRIDGTEVSIGVFSLAGGIVHKVNCLADINGLSCEDKMTLMAYHSLLMFEKAMDQRIEESRLASSIFVHTKHR